MKGEEDACPHAELWHGLFQKELPRSPRSQWFMGTEPQVRINSVGFYRLVDEGMTERRARES